jgi:hypothetical protein
MPNNYQILLTIIASISSGLLGIFINYKRDKNKEKVRLQEKEHDSMLLEIKDLQITLYKLEKDIDIWKEKYYHALQDLIKVKTELESVLSRLEGTTGENHAEIIDVVDRLDKEFLK